MQPDLRRSRQTGAAVRKGNPLGQSTLIPDFDKIISVIRSREIYVSIVVQSLSQLEGLFDHARAQTIINNCDTCLYLGGTDVPTAQYFAEKLNRQTATVLDLPLNSMFLFTRGGAPRQVQKYDLGQDDAYRRLMAPRSRETEDNYERQ